MAWRSQLEVALQKLDGERSHLVNVLRKVNEDLETFSAMALETLTDSPASPYSGPAPVVNGFMSNALLGMQPIISGEGKSCDSWNDSKLIEDHILAFV
jgi:hypothetical protein